MLYTKCPSCYDPHVGHVAYAAPTLCESCATWEAANKTISPLRQVLGLSEDWSHSKVVAEAAAKLDYLQLTFARISAMLDNAGYTPLLDASVREERRLGVAVIAALDKVIAKLQAQGAKEPQVDELQDSEFVVLSYDWQSHHSFAENNFTRFWHTDQEIHRDKIALQRKIDDMIAINNRDQASWSGPTEHEPHFVPTYRNIRVFCLVEQALPLTPPDVLYPAPATGGDVDGDAA